MDQQQLKALVHYDPETGLVTFKWRKRHTPTMGTLTRNGHRNVDVRGETIGVRNLAWIYMTGRQPPRPIGHIDEDRSNNRWANLFMKPEPKFEREPGTAKPPRPQGIHDLIV